MKKAFKRKDFSPESQDIIRQAVTIIDRYQRAGYKLSLRQLYYQLVSINAVPNTEKSYDRIGSIIADARMAGLCDWDMIEDRNRETVTPSHWSSPADIINMAAKAYHIDKWDTQPHYCEVMVEKQALEGVLQPVCRELDIPFTANKGYSSVTMMHEIGQRIIKEFRKRVDRAGLMPDKFKDEDRPMYFNEWLVRENFAEEFLPLRLSQKGKDEGFPRIVIFYMGDHDPSGMDMTRDVADRLQMFSDYTPIEVQRLALNMDQIEELSPPENPAKMTDSRAKDYVEKFGESSWELDAVRPDAMATMVREAVATIRDDKLFKVALKREAAETKVLEKLARENPMPVDDTKKKGKK